MAAVVAQEAANGQVDGHPVAGLQVHRQDDGGAVLLVLHVFVTGSGHHLAVDQQGGAGGQRVPGGAGIAVDSERQVIDAGTRHSKDAGGGVVAVAEVDEDVLVGDEHVVAERPETFQTVLVGQSDREGAAAGCGGGEGRRDGVRAWRKKRIKLLCAGGDGPSLTSHVVEDGFGLGQLGLQFAEAGVEELLHSVDLLLHQTAAARRLVGETHWTHTQSPSRWAMLEKETRKNKTRILAERYAHRFRCWDPRCLCFRLDLPR